MGACDRCRDCNGCFRKPLEMSRHCRRWQLTSALGAEAAQFRGRDRLNLVVEDDMLEGTSSASEYGTTAKNSSKPVAVIGGIGCYAKQGPYLTESCLLMFKRSGINEGASPSRVVSSHLSRHRLSSYEM